MLTLARNPIPYPARPASAAPACCARPRFSGSQYPLWKTHQSYDIPVRPFSTRPSSVLGRKEANTLATRAPSQASNQGERFYNQFVDREKNQLIGQLRASGGLHLRQNASAASYNLLSSQRGNFVDGKPRGQPSFDYGYKQPEFKAQTHRAFPNRIQTANTFRDAHSGSKYNYDFGYW